jgi:hypothetical protein
MSVPSLRSLAILLSILAVSSLAFADRSDDRTRFGHNITVGAGEEVGDVTCFGCSIHLKGHAAGDVTTFGGSIIIEDDGRVDGDVTTFAGNMRIDKQVTINGDVTLFGGRLHRDAAANIGGDVTNFGGGGFWILLFLLLPFVILGLFIAGIVWLIRRLLRPAVATA